MSCIITNIYFVDKRKDYKIHELGDIIEFGKLHTVVITEFNYTCEEFLRVIDDTLIIHDITKIIYEYLANKHIFHLLFTKSGNTMEADYLCNNVFYDFYMFNASTSHHRYGIITNTCPTIYKKKLNGENCRTCTCKTKMHNDLILKSIVNDYMPDHIPWLRSMCKIFECMIQHYYKFDCLSI